MEHPRSRGDTLAADYMVNPHRDSHGAPSDHVEIGAGSGFGRRTFATDGAMSGDDATIMFEFTFLQELIARSRIGLPGCVEAGRLAATLHVPKDTLRVPAVYILQIPASSAATAILGVRIPFRRSAPCPPARACPSARDDAECAPRCPIPERLATFSTRTNLG